MFCRDSVTVVIARAEEGEKLWSKMKEREKRFAERKTMVATLRNENASLKLDKKCMQTEINKLNKCFEAFNIQLGETGDKLDMPWLLSQLRDNVSLKERINELEDVILGNGYTVKAAEAEHDFRKKEFELATEIEKVTRVLEMLKGHIEGGDNKSKASALISKLEEALLIHDYEEYAEDFMNDMVSETSSGITSMISNENKQVIVTMPSHEQWNECTVMSGFTEGCSPSRGLFHRGPIDEEEKIDEAMVDEQEHDTKVTKDRVKEEAHESSYIYIEDENVPMMSISGGSSSYTTSLGASDDESTLSSKALTRKTRVLSIIVNDVNDCGHRQNS